MIEWPQAGTALLLGLSGAGHCIGMCGGIVSALQLSGKNTLGGVCIYHAARIVSYAALGGVFGLLAGTIEHPSWATGMRYVAAALLVGMGLYIAGWWRGMAQLERVGATLFGPIQKRASALLQDSGVNSNLALGLFWGFIPCGLIYSSLAWAGTSGSPVEAALLMLLFGMGTLPAMFAVSLGAARVQSLLRKRELKSVIGILVILGGVWTGYLAYSHSHPMAHGAPSTHDMHQHH